MVCYEALRVVPVVAICPPVASYWATCSAADEAQSRVSGAVVSAWSSVRRVPSHGQGAPAPQQERFDVFGGPVEAERRHRFDEHAQRTRDLQVGPGARPGSSGAEAEREVLAGLVDVVVEAKLVGMFEPVGVLQIGRRVNTTSPWPSGAMSTPCNATLAVGGRAAGQAPAGHSAGFPLPLC